MDNNFDKENQLRGYYDDKKEPKTEYIIHSSDIRDISNAESFGPNDSASPKKVDKGAKVFLYIFIIILSALIIFFAYILFMSNSNGNHVFNQFFGGKASTSTSSTQNNIDANGSTIDLVDKREAEGTLSAQDIYRKLAPSIVGIVTYNPSQGLISSSAGQGSGIVMSQDGYIVTNAHVIGNSNKYNVTVVAGDKEYSARVVGFDTRTDLAVLKIEATGLKPAEFGNSDQMEVGEWVLALGNPGGLEFSNSLTRGILSAKDRSLGASNSPVKYLQTDAPINPGNSGGALSNMYGQVIGINTAKASEFEGLGFAIPSNTVKNVTDDIIKKGYVSGRVRLGVSVRPLSAYEAQANDVPQGLLISEIAGDSNVAASGIKVGDIITKIDGVSTPTTASLFGELLKHKPGDIITLTVYRVSYSYTRSQANGSYIEAKISLIEDKGQMQ